MSCSKLGQVEQSTVEAHKEQVHELNSWINKALGEIAMRTMNCCKVWSKYKLNFGVVVLDAYASACDCRS